MESEQQLHPHEWDSPFLAASCLCCFWCELASFSLTRSCVVGRVGPQLPQLSNLGGNRKFFSSGKVFSLRLCVGWITGNRRWYTMVLAYLGLGLTRMASWGADLCGDNPTRVSPRWGHDPCQEKRHKKYVGRLKQRASTVHCFQPFDCLVFSHTYTHSYAIKKDTLH